MGERGGSGGAGGFAVGTGAQLGQDRRVVDGRSKLTGSHKGGVVHGSARGACHLGCAAQRVGVLDLGIPHPVRGHDRGVGEHSQHVVCTCGLAGVRTQRCRQLRHEDLVRTEQRLHAERSGDIRRREQLADVCDGHQEHAQHALGAVDQRQTFLLGEDDRLDAVTGEQRGDRRLTPRSSAECLAKRRQEQRTPLNSILILSQQLAENSPGNLSGKQVEFSRNINSSGTDLLHLINDILDLSKIESGTVSLDIEDVPFSDLRATIDRNFRHVAEAKNLPFHIKFAEDLPRSMDSDPKRLQQIPTTLATHAHNFPPPRLLRNPLLRWPVYD